MSPLKHTNFRNEIRFSEWIESMRKDVECAFGILKGRWRILRYGIRLWGIKSTDKVWMTCCALHNWLLEVDGLADGWANGVKSYWETAPDQPCDVPFAIKRLRKPGKNRSVEIPIKDLSGFGKGNDVQSVTLSDDDDSVIGESEHINSIKENGAIPLRKLSRDYFRAKLIRHFNIAFNKHEVQWPTRLGEEKNE